MGDATSISVLSYYAHHVNIAMTHLSLPSSKPINSPTHHHRRHLRRPQPLAKCVGKLFCISTFFGPQRGYRDAARTVSPRGCMKRHEALRWCATVDGLRVLGCLRCWQETEEAWSVKMMTRLTPFIFINRHMNILKLCLLLSTLLSSFLHTMLEIFLSISLNALLSFFSCSLVRF